MQQTTKKGHGKFSGRALLFATAVLLSITLGVMQFAFAVPNGAQMSFNSSQTSTSINPTELNDSGGTISTLKLSTVQQDSAWKGYLGNVSGSLTLDDLVGNTIYNWQLATVTGKVFASRSNSVTWSSINCSNQTYVDAEQTALSFASADSDSINKTFNSTNHQAFLVAARNMTGCRSTATYVNDTTQAQVPGALFQEAVLTDGSAFVYASLINTQRQGFNAQFTDFQMIVPQSKSTATPTPYYFYIELG